MRKKGLILVLLSVICAAFMLTSCSVSGYFKEISSYSFWENTGDTAIPQTQFFNLMNDFMSDGTIVDGNVIGSDGKRKRIAFIGFDGVRADALTNILLDKNSKKTNGKNSASPYGALKMLIEGGGGAYIAYCGGEVGKPSRQQTSTSPGWTTIFTGVWNNKHGVRGNNDVKNMDCKTIMLQYAEKGLSTSFAFRWSKYLDLNLKNEVKYAMENPALPVKYLVFERKGSGTGADPKEFVANPDYDNSADAKFVDDQLTDHYIGRIEADDDMVFAIFESTDTNGHGKGFRNSNNSYVNAVRNCDLYAARIVEHIKTREAENNEDWLIVITTDHGGRAHSHGLQSAQAKIIWAVCNKKISSDYFGSNFDGKKEKS